jgi:hypothetical protein
MKMNEKLLEMLAKIEEHGVGSLDISHDWDGWHGSLDIEPRVTNIFCVVENANTAENAINQLYDQLKNPIEEDHS